jgi:hypothetical protein
LFAGVFGAFLPSAPPKPFSPRAELVDGTTKAGVLLWIEWIPRQDELVSGAASLALKRRPEKDWADD